MGVAERFLFRLCYMPLPGASGSGTVPLPDAPGNQKHSATPFLNLWLDMKLNRPYTYLGFYLNYLFRSTY